MAKRNLLDMVQEILSDLDSDEVNSIEDTTESEQVVTILKSTYNAMMSNRDWPHLRRGIQITSYGDLSRPTHMKIQDAIKELCFINYNKIRDGETRVRFEKIKYLQTDEFLHKTNRENSDNSEVISVTDPSGISLLIRNDRAPEYYTSFDDSTIVFNSYDSSVDSTLQESKIQAQAYVMPTWISSDDFIPDLPDNAFTALVEEAKAKAMFRLKQMVDSKAEQEAGRQQRWLSRKSRRVEGGIKYPDYGRRSRGRRRDATFRVED